MTLSNKIVDERIAGKNIKRLDSFITTETKIRFQCLIDEYIWMTTPKQAINGKGCPKCLNLIKITNDILDQRLIGRNIIRLNDVHGNKERINFQCTICDYIWKTSSDSILNQKSGCHVCSGTLLSNKKVDQILTDRNIKRIDNYINCRTKINFQCLDKKCNFLWSALPSNIIWNRKNGCPQCNGGVVFDNNIIDNRLLNRKIKRLDNYINSYTKINFQCLSCNHIWSATTSNVCNYETGCPNCSSGKNERLVSAILYDFNISFNRHYHINKIIPNESKTLFIDFYLENIKTIIEYNGEQHYRPVCFGGMEKNRAEQEFIKQKERDEYLRNICKNNNITLIEIDGRKLINSKLENYMTNILIPTLIKERLNI